MAVDSAYDDILAMSATLQGVSHFVGYEVMHSATLSLTVGDEVSH